MTIGGRTRWALGTRCTTTAERRRRACGRVAGARCRLAVNCSCGAGVVDAPTTWRAPSALAGALRFVRRDAPGCEQMVILIHVLAAPLRDGVRGRAADRGRPRRGWRGAMAPAAGPRGARGGARASTPRRRGSTSSLPKLGVARRGARRARRLGQRIPALAARQCGDRASVGRGGGAGSRHCSSDPHRTSFAGETWATLHIAGALAAYAILLVAALAALLMTASRSACTGSSLPPRATAPRRS